MDVLTVALVALLASGLTLFSGFGLGTLLLPVFALFMPVDVAVGATALVHAANNVFKVAVVGRQADWGIALRFGVPAILAAFLGAALLGLVAVAEPWFQYTVGGRQAVVTPVKLSLAALMAAFALFELLPKLRDFQMRGNHLVTGGILSGFFGGFSGHQGALRSAFLVKAGMSPAAFVGTTAVISFSVDAVRIAVYAVSLFVLESGTPVGPDAAPLVWTGIAAAFVGVFVGSRLLHKVTMRFIQYLTGILLLLVSLALGSGII